MANGTVKVSSAMVHDQRQAQFLISDFLYRGPMSGQGQGCIPLYPRTFAKVEHQKKSLAPTGQAHSGLLLESQFGPSFLMCFFFGTFRHCSQVVTMKYTLRPHVLDVAYLI